MKKFFIQTFGCQMNTADTEKINMILLQSGIIKSNNIGDADIVIFNTCSVRQKGEDRVFGFIENIYKEAKKENKKLIIGVTGCMVRRTGFSNQYLDNIKTRKRARKIKYIENENEIFNNDDKLFPRSEKIDFVFRIEETKYLNLILSHIFGEQIGADYKYDDYLKIKQFRENESIATTIIQTGCDNYCSYCIVPYTRGKEKSREISDIITEIKENAESGAKEIILVGQNVNSYGKQFTTKEEWNKETNNWNPNKNFTSPFRKLLNEINTIDGIKRIRFSSSNPHDMTKDILNSHFELDKTCNYLHFALQSGSDEILKKMNRKHTYNDFKEMVDYLRSKDPLFSISTDIIVGFSGETDEIFNHTIKAFKECDFDFAYNARYSVRKGTLAHKIYPDDISYQIKAKRWHILNDLLLGSIKKRNQLMLDRVEEILIYGKKESLFFGRTRNFKEVYFSGNGKIKIGDIVNVKLNSIDKYIIKGELISN